MRNRLEHLRKRQRKEALQAQEELLAGVANAASKQPIPMAPPPVPEKVLNTVAEDNVLVEEYSRAMSPPLLELNKLSSDDKMLKIVIPKDDLRELVCGAMSR